MVEIKINEKVVKVSNNLTILQACETAGVIVHTGPTNSSADTERAVFSKLDDLVSIADFGVVGDGNPFTQAGFPVYKQIQQAVDQTFKNVSQSAHKKLFFPAGTYVITGTIYLPPHAAIIGDGVNNTILQASGTWVNSGTVWSSFSATSVFQTVGSTAGSRDLFPNIGSALTGPRDVTIDKLHFKYDDVGAVQVYCEPLIRIDAATDVQIDHCKFEGHFVSQGGGSDYYCGIEQRAQNAVITENVQIKNSTFDSLRNGIITNYDNVNDTIISGNRFNNLRIGVLYANALGTGQKLGPYRTKFVENLFENIDRQAIYVGTPTNANVQFTNHISSNNSFTEVGNNRHGETSGTFSVVHFGSAGNTTKGDRFERDNWIRSQDNDAWTYVAPIHGNIYYEPEVAYKSNVQYSAVTPATLARIPFSGVDQLIKISYSLSKTTVSRKGDLLINVSTGLGTGSTATITDSYTYYGTNDGAITFDVDLNTANQTVKVIYNTASALGTLEYKYNYLG
jgi:hypothetical protein